MTEQDKLLERGRDCLAVLDAVLDRDLKGEDFDSANILAHEYIGAAMMLHCLELISGEEYYAWTEGVRSRYLRSRYPKTYPGEEPGPRDRQQKDRSKPASLKRSRPGLAPGTTHKKIISDSRQNASPNPDREGGFSRGRMGSRFDGDRDRLADRLAVPAHRYDREVNKLCCKSLLVGWTLPPGMAPTPPCSCITSSIGR